MKPFMFLSHLLMFKREREKEERMKVEETYPKSFEPLLDGGLVVAGVFLQILQIDFGNLLFAAQATHFLQFDLC